MQNGLSRKKVNLLPLKLKILKTPELAYCQSTSFVKKSMGQINVSIYRENIITAKILAILPGFVRKSHFHRPVTKKLLYIHKAYLLMSINLYLYHPHFVLSQASTTNHQLQKLLLTLEPWIIFLQFMHIFLSTKNIIISSKLDSKKYL